MLSEKQILKTSAIIWKPIENIHDEEKHQATDADACDICLNSYPIRVAVWAEEKTKASCLEIAKRQMDLLVMENTKRVMDKTSSGFSEYLKSNLQAIIDNDKTPKYEYGDEDENKNAKGQSPPDRGERWSMPREIAESLLADNRGWERTHIDDFKTYQNHNEKHMLGDNIHPECAFCKCEQVVREEILPLQIEKLTSDSFVTNIVCLSEAFYMDEQQAREEGSPKADYYHRKWKEAIKSAIRNGVD